MVKIFVEFLFAAAAKTVEAFAGGGHRRAVEQHAAVHGCMVVRGGNVHSAVKHKEGLRTLAESLVQMTCSDFTIFLKLTDFTL